MKNLKLVIIAFLVVACSGPTTGDDGTPMLHPVEAVCIDYTMSGAMQNGTSTKCHRDYGYEQYEIQNTSIGFGGFTKTQSQHTIIIGDQTYTINLQTNTATQITNPMYAEIVSALENTTPEQMAATFFNAMGYTQTGATKTIADTPCKVYSSPMVGTACLTDEGLLLEQSTMGMMTQTAISVSIGNGGDDANYTLYQSVPISQGPDLSDGLDGLMQQFQGQQ